MCPRRCLSLTRLIMMFHVGVLSALNYACPCVLCQMPKPSCIDVKHSKINNLIKAAYHFLLCKILDLAMTMGPKFQAGSPLAEASENRELGPVPASTVEWKVDCFSAETSCNSRGSELLWGCCPLSDAVCCPDRRTCCPSGTGCSSGGWCSNNRTVALNNNVRFGQG